MAKIEEKDDVVKTSAEDKAPEQSSPVEKAPDLGEIFKRLDSLEAENKELRAKDSNPNIEARKKYAWPWAFSYKMWWGVPVLSWKTIRKDKTRDLTYKNDFWVITSNHYLDLDLANGKKIQVEVNEFNEHLTRSEKIICEVIWEFPWNPKWFKFKHPDYDNFTVLPNYIN